MEQRASGCSRGRVEESLADLAERWDDDEDLRVGFWAPVLEDLARRHPDGIPSVALDRIADSIAGVRAARRRDDDV